MTDENPPPPGLIKPTTTWRDLLDATKYVVRTTCSTRRADKIPVRIYLFVRMSKDVSEEWHLGFWRIGIQVVERGECKCTCDLRVPCCGGIATVLMKGKEKLWSLRSYPRRLSDGSRLETEPPAFPYYLTLEQFQSFLAVHNPEEEILFNEILKKTIPKYLKSVESAFKERPDFF
jgi:hypothetical protein